MTEALVIDLGGGSCVPRLAYRNLSPPARGRTPLEPGLVVVQFADIQSAGAGEQMALALTESLVHALSIYPGPVVIGPVVSERGVGAPVDARAALVRSTRDTCCRGGPKAPIPHAGDGPALRLCDR